MAAEAVPLERQVELLKTVLREKGDFLSNLKQRTKAFVDNLKAEKSSIEEQLDKRTKALREAEHQRDALKEKVQQYEQKYTPEESRGSESALDGGLAELDQLRKDADEAKATVAAGQSLLEAARKALHGEKSAVRRLAEELALAKEQNAALTVQLTEAAKFEKRAALLETELDAAKRRAANVSEELVMLKEQQILLLRDFDARSQAQMATKEEALKALTRELEEVRVLHAQAEQRTAEAQTALVGRERELERLRVRQAETEKEGDSLRTRLSEVEERSEALRSQLAEANQRLKSLEDELVCARTSSAPPAQAQPTIGPPAPAHIPGHPLSVNPASPGGDLIDLGFTDMPAPPALSETPPITSPAAGVMITDVSDSAPTPTFTPQELQELESLRERVQDLTRDIEEHKGRELELNEKLSHSGRTAELLRDQVVTLEASLHQESESAAALRGQLTSAEEAHCRAKGEAKKLGESLERELEAMASLRGKLEEAEMQAEAYESRKSSALAQQHEERQSMLQASEAAWAREREELVAARAGAESQLQSLQKSLETKEGVMPAALDAAKSEGEAGAKEELDGLKRQVKSLEDERVSLSKAVEMVAADKSELMEAQEITLRERNNLKEQLEMASAALQSLQEAHDKLKQELALHEKRAKEERRSFQDRLSSKQREADEAMKRVRADAETELASVRHELSEARSAKAMMEKSVAAMNTQVESLKRALNQLGNESEASIDELQQAKARLTAELAAERESGHERRRQMKSYLETLGREKQDLEGELTTVKAELAESRKSERTLQTAVSGLEERLAAQVEANEHRVAELEGQLKEQDKAMRAAVAERNDEISKLRHEEALKLDTTAKRSEEMAQTLQVAEAETAEHKAKRLAAKNEMIVLVQKLEGVSAISRAVEQTLRASLVPKALEQATLLEQSVMQVEELCRRLGGPPTNRARSRGSGSRANGGLELAARRRRTRSPSEDRLMASVRSSSLDGTHSSTELDAGSASSGLKDPSHSTEEGAHVHDKQDVKLQPLATEEVDRLLHEMERVSSGLTLLTHSLEKLSDVAITIQERSCTRIVQDCLSFARPAPGPYTRVLQTDPSLSPR